MTIATEEAKQHAIKQLRTILPKGSTVYTILKHISRSGMFRIIDLIYIKENHKELIKLTYEHEARCDCKAIKELRAELEAEELREGELECR